MDKVVSHIELSSWIENTLNIFLNLIGLEITIGADAPERSLYDFEKRVHAQDVHEYFGLGLHLILSPLRQAKK
jgi:hypothetical protein